MYSMFTHIYHTIQLNVGKYIIHGWYGYGKVKEMGLCSQAFLPLNHYQKAIHYIPIIYPWSRHATFGQNGTGSSKDDDINPEKKRPWWNL